LNLKNKKINSSEHALPGKLPSSSLRMRLFSEKNVKRLEDKLGKDWWEKS